MTSRFLALAAAAAFTLAAGAAQAADYVIDTKGAHASINFKVKHLGFSWLTGRFDSFSGTFSYDEANPAASKVAVEIDTASVNSNHGERDKHLKSSDFLEVGKFPKATFVSKAITVGADGRAKIAGDFTLRGVTKEIVIDAERIGGGKDPWGGFREGFTGTTTIALSDYGINFDLGPAAKTIELTLHVEGLKK